MDRGAIFRRAFHLASPVFLSYYLLPDQITPNITRLSLALLFIGTAGCVEIARIALGIRLFGMRPYEGQRVSAYAQGLLGLSFGLFVIQDPRIVVPVFIGMAWIDPLAGYCRRHDLTFLVPALAYFTIFAVTSAVLHSFSAVNTVFYGMTAAGVAVVMEGPKIPQVDDDLLMQVLPMVALYFLFVVAGTGFTAR